MVRAKMTRTFCSTGRSSGGHFAELYSTQPFMAFVMMKVWARRMTGSSSRLNPWPRTVWVWDEELIPPVRVIEVSEEDPRRQEAEVGED